VLHRSRPGREDWLPSGGWALGSSAARGLQATSKNLRWAELDAVSALQNGTSPGRSADLEYRVQDALPEERRFSHVVVERDGCWIFPKPTNAYVVLEVFPDARKMLHARYSQRCSSVWSPIPGQHQHLWRVDRAPTIVRTFHSGSDALNLSVRTISTPLAGLPLMTSRVTSAWQSQPSGSAGPCRESIRNGIRMPHSVADSQVHDGGTAITFHQQPVLALKSECQRSRAASTMGRGHRVRVWRGLNKTGPPVHDILGPARHSQSSMRR